MSAAALSAEPGTEEVELAITGMTCAACAARVERTLNKLDGVSASVNYATERASVRYDPRALSAPDLVARVRTAGYDAVLPAVEPADGGQDAALAALYRRAVICGVLAAPTFAMAMIAPLQFPGWQWLALALSFAYNIAALPLAAAGLLNPLIAGAAMALSSVCVVANALRLRRFRSDHAPT